MTRVAAQLAVGQSARVAKVEGSGDICQRLLEMGITPGVELRCLGRAPLGDPVEFEVRGYRLSLRCREAEQIEIHPGDQENTETKTMQFTGGERDGR